MSKEFALQQIEHHNPKLLIVGYRPDGRRSRPINYEYFEEVFPDERTAGSWLIDKGITIYRVYGLTEAPGVDIIFQAHVQTDRENEQKERELLAQLKDKYEK